MGRTGLVRITRFCSDLLFGEFISIEDLLHRLTSQVKFLTTRSWWRSTEHFLEAEAWAALCVQVEMSYCYAAFRCERCVILCVRPVCLFSFSTLQPVWMMETNLVSIPVTNDENYENKFILVYSRNNLLESSGILNIASEKRKKKKDRIKCMKCQQVYTL